MKKFLAILLILTVCAGLCACGTSAQIAESANSAAQDQSAGELKQSEPGEVAENSGSAEETYPWEAEFNEDDFVKTKYNVGDKITYYREGNIYGLVRREIYEWMDGTVSDSYYYPDGTLSHDYWTYPDGIMMENHYLNNGYVDIQNHEVIQGTKIYCKQTNPDGAEYETFYNEDGKEIRFTNSKPDGSYEEVDMLTGKYVGGNFNTGAYWEQENFENGTIKRNVSYDPAADIYIEVEYYENGQEKYSKNRNAEYSMEQRHDEEGYCTYFYSKDIRNNYEIECIADESGKLIKVIENGTVYEDAGTLAQYKGYNFRG